MKREEIMKLEAGRELDILVHNAIGLEKLCQHERDEYGKCKYCGLNHAYFLQSEPPRHYSTEIAAAWMIVEKLVDNGQRDFDMVTTIRGWTCRFDLNDGCAGKAESAPLAICRAALMIALVEDKK